MTIAATSDSPNVHYRAARPVGVSAEMVTTSRPQFAKPGLDQFEWLAVHEPAELAELALHKVNHDPVLLSQAAMAMSKSSDTALMTRVLLGLSQHHRPFVREAALLGLAPFLAGSLDARDRTREMASTDPSPGVREAAAEALLTI